LRYPLFVPFCVIAVLPRSFRLLLLRRCDLPFTLIAVDLLIRVLFTRTTYADRYVYCISQVAPPLPLRFPAVTLPAGCSLLRTRVLHPFATRSPPTTACVTGCFCRLFVYDYTPHLPVGLRITLLRILLRYVCCVTVLRFFTYLITYYGLIYRIPHGL